MKFYKLQNFPPQYFSSTQYYNFGMQLATNVDHVPNSNRFANLYEQLIIDKYADNSWFFKNM